MLPPIVDKLPLASKKRFELAQCPINMGRSDGVDIDRMQAWLNALDLSLPKSTTRNAEGSISADGILGSETFRAVQKFQVANGLKPNEMAGRDTLNKIAEKLGKKLHKPVG